MKKSYIAPQSELLSMSIEEGILLSSIVVNDTPQNGSDAWTSGKDIWNNDQREW